ncbi:MAG: glycoside hydrolase family 15 protein [Candidatus Woesearchaeota archaeon]
MMLMKSFRILNSMRHPNGLFSASKISVRTGYDKSWIRDNVYESMGLEAIDPDMAARTYHALLDIFLKHEWKIDWAIKNKPTQSYQYIHARYHPHKLTEFWEEWGNKQNDAVGAFLFKIADLMDKGVRVLRDSNDKRIIEKLVMYLGSIEYWQDTDNGIWEENEEVHASSIGACVAGLKRISRYVDVPEWLIHEGEMTLNTLLPRESDTKHTDMALLSLIWPYNVVSREQRDRILANVETRLLRNRGVIRYEGDRYYNRDGEAEWTMGLAWLAVIYKHMEDFAKYRFYVQKTIDAMNDNGELPELYFSASNKYNENTPLGWAQALYIIAVS